MDSTAIVILLERITAFVDAGGMTFEEKRKALLELATDDDKTALAEFVSWFREFEP